MTSQGELHLFTQHGTSQFCVATAAIGPLVVDVMTHSILGMVFQGGGNIHVHGFQSE